MVFPIFFRKIMTVEEVASRINRTKWSVYKAIKQKRGVGLIFQRRAGQGWFAYSKDVNKFMRES